ncbi:MAG: HTH domain-containing protein [Myxococcaceae bacterium]|nr:HTH domain-containing protein [Myxococcaceae bacterium]
MRASRLLHLLLLLQNRGRLTCGHLANELEVTRRTVLRDLEALEEAGLPVVVHRGARGGVELGFNYRSRLTGLSQDEAEALGVILSHPMPALNEVGLEDAARRARAKLLESLPDGVREAAQRGSQQLRFAARRRKGPDERVLALARAIRAGTTVRLRATSARPREVHPVALIAGPRGWALVDARAPEVPIPEAEWHDVNVSARRFSAAPATGGPGQA